jgi:hypothetical protein
MSKKEYEGDSSEGEASSNEELGFLSDKIRGLLAENNISSIADLKANEANIADLKGVGPKTVEKIKEHIAENE